MVNYLLRILLIGISGGLALNKMGAREDPAHPLSQKGLMFVGFVISLGILQPATVALAVVYMASAEDKPSEKVAFTVSWLAKQTYDIYLLHPLVLIFLFMISPPSLWFFTGTSSSAARFFLFGALTLALSMLGGYVQRRLCSVCLSRFSAVAHAAWSRARYMFYGGVASLGLT